MTPEDKVYLIFRVYDKKERPDQRYDRNRLYGWTYDKNVVKALFTQRNKEKYKVIKTTIGELGEEYFENNLEFEKTIEFLPLKFASSYEEIHFFTTFEEMQETEIRIQRHFRELSDIVTRDNGKTTLLTLFLNLDEYYADALEYIGFRPPELDDLFPSACDSMEDLIDTIADGYTSYLDAPQEDFKAVTKAPGTTFMNDIYTKILYSVESFVKILKEDL